MENMGIISVEDTNDDTSTGNGPVDVGIVDNQPDSWEPEPDFEITPLSVELMARHMILGDAKLIVMSGFPQERANPVSHLDDNVILERDENVYRFSQSINYEKTSRDNRNLASEVRALAAGESIGDGLINPEHPLIEIERLCERGRRRAADKQHKWAFAFGNASRQGYVALDVIGHGRIGHDHRGEPLLIHVEFHEGLAQKLGEVLAADEPIHTEVSQDKRGAFPIYPRDWFLYHLLTTDDTREVMPTRKTPNLTNTPEETRYELLNELRDNYRVDRNLKRSGRGDQVIDNVSENIKQFAADEHPIDIKMDGLFLDIDSIKENARLVD